MDLNIEARKSTPGASREATYADLLIALDGLIAGERDAIANLANTAALIYAGCPISLGRVLPLRRRRARGRPFQGKPACLRIAFGAGVCGTAAARRATVIVADVHAFSRPHRLRRGVQFRNRRAACWTGRACSACSTSTARCTPALRCARCA